MTQPARTRSARNVSSPQRVGGSPAAQDTPWHRWCSSPRGFLLEITTCRRPGVFVVQLPSVGGGWVGGGEEVDIGGSGSVEPTMSSAHVALRPDFSVEFQQAVPPRHLPACGCVAPLLTPPTCAFPAPTRHVRWHGGRATYGNTSSSCLKCWRSNTNK